MKRPFSQLIFPVNDQAQEFALTNPGCAGDFRQRNQVQAADHCN